MIQMVLLLVALLFGADSSLTIMLTGASFGHAANGWFEVGCKSLHAEPLNKSVPGEAIFHTANRMALGTFYTREELERSDVLVLMHVHDKDVVNPSVLKERYTDYAMPTKDYAVAFDYVIKKYRDDCYQLRLDSTSAFYRSEKGKPVIIVLCTHWHDARTIYNRTVRQLAAKWNLPLVEWDKHIGFSKEVLVEGRQPSLQYSMDTQVIDGVTYGWHPKRGENEYIQKKLAEIFVQKMKTVIR